MTSYELYRRAAELHFQFKSLLALVAELKDGVTTLDQVQVDLDAESWSRSAVVPTSLPVPDAIVGRMNGDGLLCPLPPVLDPLANIDEAE